MRLRLPRTSDAFQRTLPSGVITLSEDSTARVHDGAIPGGLLLPTEQVFEPPYSGPGPQELIAGNWQAGFYGEVPVSELISGADLATLIGLTNGTAQHSNEPWLKFIHRSKVLFVAKKPYRHSISWNQIHARGAVFGTGPSEIEIGEDSFTCRLLTGANEDPTSAATGNNPPGTEDSEWNRLLYPIHVDYLQERAWAQYTDADLILRYANGNGYYQWCQETNAASSGQRVSRGGSGVTYFGTNVSSNTSANRGWRPCLELLGPVFYPPESLYYLTDYLNAPRVTDHFGT